MLVACLLGCCHDNHGSGLLPTLHRAAHLCTHEFGTVIEIHANQSPAPLYLHVWAGLMSIGQVRRRDRACALCCSIQLPIPASCHRWFGYVSGLGSQRTVSSAVTCCMCATLSTQVCFIARAHAKWATRRSAHAKWTTRRSAHAKWATRRSAHLQPDTRLFPLLSCHGQACLSRSRCVSPSLEIAGGAMSRVRCHAATL